jgi:hypothetical protein
MLLVLYPCVSVGLCICLPCHVMGNALLRYIYIYIYVKLCVLVYVHNILRLSN